MLRKLEKMDKNLFVSSLKDNNIVASSEQILLFEKIMENTIKTNEQFNLTSITNESEFREKMIFDSILGIKFIEGENKKIIDVGTGAGFPGLPLAVIDNKNEYYLLDSTKKKIDYIQKFIDENKLLNVKTINDRVENFTLSHRENFDYGVARAVAHLSILIETIIPLLKVGGYFVAYKGKNVDQEILESTNAFKKLNCSIVCKNYETLPSSKEERYILVIKKDKETNKKYPRNYSLIVSKPL